MTENMKKFLELVSADKQLMEKVSVAQKDMLIAIAKENGIELIEADFAAPTGELSDDELDSIAHAFQGESFDKISTTEIVQKLVKVSPKALLKLGKFI